MKSIVLLLASLMAIEALVVTLLPDRVKAWVEELATRDLRTMGILELVIVGVVLYYTLTSGG